MDSKLSKNSSEELFDLEDLMPSQENIEKEEDVFRYLEDHMSALVQSQNP